MCRMMRQPQQHNRIPLPTHEVGAEVDGDAPKRHRHSTSDDTTSSLGISKPYPEPPDNSAIRCIRRYSEDKKRRMPTNVKTYDGIGDLDDHLKVFEAAAKIERWPEPIWCHMSRLALIGLYIEFYDNNTQGYLKVVLIFDNGTSVRRGVAAFIRAEDAAADSRREYSGYRAPDQPKKQFNDRGGNRSIKDFEELRKAFRRNFTQRKKYSKNPVELARIRQRSGEYLDSFSERFKDEMVYFKHCPDLMKISAYMNGINNQDLIKKLNDKVPQTFDELMRRVSGNYHSVVEDGKRQKSIIKREIRATGHLINPKRKIQHRPRENRRITEITMDNRAKSTSRLWALVRRLLDAAGRLQKWSVLLGEYNITYRPRTAIKGHILADFIVELPDDSQASALKKEILPQPWTLITDGSSRSDGSGAGLILTDPEGIQENILIFRVKPYEEARTRA
ncbi:reverse transcriptase domain-containing protein [Tanacetum coccineum]